MSLRRSSTSIFEAPEAGARLGRFAVALALALIVLPLAYFAVFDRAIALRDADRDPSYGAFLLREVEGPRLLIESGSNAVHGFAPGLIEQAFDRPVAVLADHAGYPLWMKIERLKAAVRPGDTIVMPLEWTYYSGVIFDWNLAPNFQWLLSSYYRPLDFRQRLEIVLGHMDLSSYIHSALDTIERGLMTTEALARETLLPLRERFTESPYNVLPRDRSDVPEGVPMTECRPSLLLDKPVFPEKALAGFRRLAELEEMGARVILTWPAVVGPGCYEPGDADLARYEAAVREEAARIGIEIAGDPRDFWLPDPDYYLDTPYHLVLEGARIRTETLIEKLQPMLEGEAALRHPTPVQADRELSALSEELVLPAADRLPPLQTGRYPVPAGEGPGAVLLGQGWYRPEADGIWSLGAVSDLFLRQGEEPCAVTLEGGWLRESSKAEIVVDGKRVPLEEGVTLPAGDDVVRLRLDHEAPAAPREIRDSADPRVLNFKLTGVTARCGG